MAAIQKDVIAAAIMQLKAEKWDALEQERKASEADRIALEREAKTQRDTAASEARRMRRQTIASGILAAVGVIGYLIEHFATHAGH